MAPAGERGTGRPKDADELAAWSEMAADAVARTESEGFKKPRTHESGRGTAATHAMEGESRAREGKPAATLEPKARTGAVSADVAGRLPYTCTQTRSERETRDRRSGRQAPR